MVGSCSHDEYFDGVGAYGQKLRNKSMKICRQILEIKFYEICWDLTRTKIKPKFFLEDSFSNFLLTLLDSSNVKHQQALESFSEILRKSFDVTKDFREFCKRIQASTQNIKFIK